MESSSNKISNQKVVEELFEQLGNALSSPVQIFVIGGAAMMEYGLKDSTKDIDIVCVKKEDKEKILYCAGDLGYTFGEPEKRHERLVVDRIAKKGGQTLDVFAGSISYDFGLSNTMWDRAPKKRVFGMAEVRYASSEDIFIMKLIANRPGDAPDCADLFSTDLNFEAVYEEIESQYRKVGEKDQKKWISHVEEGIARLVDLYDMAVPKEIVNKISYLVYDYNEGL